MLGSRPKTKRTTTTEWGIPVVLAAIGAGFAIWYGVTTWGVFFPDEIFQTLEPAHKLVFGYGFETWESTYGGRNFTLNLLMAVPYAAMGLLGIDSPADQIAMQRVLFASATAIGAVGAWRLARIGGARRIWAAAACATVAWGPLQMAMGFRTLTEVPAAALLVWGVALIYTPATGESDTRDATPEGDRGLDRLAHNATFFAGFCCLGLAVLIRLQMAIAVAGLLLTWRWRGQMERYRAGLRVLVVWALIYGLVDWIIFGFPFQSAGGYLRFHFILSGSTAYEGMNGPLFYPVVLWRTLGPGVVLLLLAPFSYGRWRGPIIGATAFVGLHFVHAHRQVRFIWPVIPLMAGLGAVGADVIEQWFRERSGEWRRTIGSVVAALLVVGVGIWSWQVTPGLTLTQLGQQQILAADADESAWGWRHDLNSLLFEAHARPDLCGLRLVRESAVNTGGYAFLHRDVPYYHALDFIPPDNTSESESRSESGSRSSSAKQTPSFEPPEPEQYNFVLARSDLGVPDRLEKVAESGQWVLYTTGATSCAADSDFVARVFRPKEIAGD